MAARKKALLRADQRTLGRSPPSRSLTGFRPETAVCSALEDKSPFAVRDREVELDEPGEVGGVAGITFAWGQQP